MRTPPIWDSQVIKANLDETGNDAAGSNVCHLESWSLRVPRPWYVCAHPHPTAGTYLRRRRHADFRNEVVLEETDDVLLLEFLCWGDFRQRWDGRPFPCLQNNRNTSKLIRPQTACEMCRNAP